jgi:hypothetical protein
MWSFGVLVYILITGQERPYGEKIDDLGIRINNRSNYPNDDLRAKLPSNLGQDWEPIISLAKDCMEFDPHHRPTAALAWERLRKRYDFAAVC